jgi:hypothetical protein
MPKSKRNSHKQVGFKILFQIVHAWEDVKAMFNGGTRKRLLASAAAVHNQGHHPQPTPTPAKQAKVTQDPSPSAVPFSANPAPLSAPPPRVPPFPDLPLPLSRSLVMDYVWHHSTGSIKHHQLPFPPYAALPWLAKRGSPFLGFGPTPHPDASLHAAVGPQAGDNKLYQSAFRPVYPVLPRPLEAEQQPEYDLETCSDEETVDIETTEEDPPASTDNGANCWSKDQVSFSVGHVGHARRAGWLLCEKTEKRLIYGRIDYKFCFRIAFWSSFSSLLYLHSVLSQMWKCFNWQQEGQS